MNKQEFLRILHDSLDRMPEAERKDVLYDYEEHFTFGVAEGKSEEEIAKSLGDPRVLARQFTANYLVNQAESSASVSNIVSALIATVGLGFFNLVFVLGPFLAVAGVLIGLFAAAVAITIAGAVGFLGILASPFFSSFIWVDSTIFANPVGALFFSIGLTSFGLLFLIGDYYLARLLYIGTIKYLRLNLKIIRGE